jgi:hypothetical protein
MPLAPPLYICQGVGMSTLWARGPSAGRVAHSILGEAEALPPSKGMYRAMMQSGKALSGATQGLSPMPGREMYERRLSPRAGERKLTREGSFP